MSLPLTIENEALRLEVYPQFGGKVASIIDKADKFELLFDYAAELPSGPLYDRPFSESWHAGWDDCFPAVAAGPYPTRPYAGIMVPDHGELWSVPANATPTKDGITVQWHGLRFGYVLARQISLEGPSIVAHYTLTNLAPFDFRFVWAQHALLSLAAPAEIDLGRVPCRVSHDANGNEHNRPLTWPTNEDGLDFSRPDSLPPKQGWKLFATDPIDRPAVVTYPNRRRTLSIEYSSPDGLSAWWGLWINTGGWMGHRHFAVEATTGRFDQVDRSIRDHSAGRVDPSSKREWTVRWNVAAAQ